MTTRPNDRPDFLCNACNHLICDDCASTAAEYEFLFLKRNIEIAQAIDEINELKREIEKLKRDVELWESVSKVGYQDTIQTWMDDEEVRTVRKDRRA